MVLVRQRIRRYRLAAHLGAYIQQPPWAKWLQRGLLIACYILMGVAGYAATSLDFPAHEAGFVVMGGSAISLGGVVTRYYQIEAIGLWPVIAGLWVCVVWLVIPPQSAVLTGWLVAGFTPMLGARLLALNLLAVEARAEAGL